MRLSRSVRMPGLAHRRARPRRRRPVPAVAAARGIVDQRTKVALGPAA